MGSSCTHNCTSRKTSELLTQGSQSISQAWVIFFPLPLLCGPLPLHRYGCIQQKGLTPSLFTSQRGRERSEEDQPTSTQKPLARIAYTWLCQCINLEFIKLCERFEVIFWLERMQGATLKKSLLKVIPYMATLLCSLYNHVCSWKPDHNTVYL